MEAVFCDKFRTRVSDFSCYDTLLPMAVLDLFQDVAGNHATHCGLGFHDLLNKNLIWVLIRTKYDVIKNPEMYSTVVVKTWAKKQGRLDFDREYAIYSLDGELLIKGISKWVIVNYTTRRVVPARDIEYSFNTEHEELYNEPFNKIEDFDIEGCEKYEANTAFCDLDHNGHVNNAKYAQFVMNALMLNKDEEIKSFEINHIKEMPANSKITIYSKKDGKVIVSKGLLDNGETSFITKIVLI